ncbi:MAG: carboxylating nicotinate-nucleotide diphosphorylase [Pseudomonadota bacterium]|nr:carboxylating nicotinate-nucleotide diphosphorylase [Pseudomonadota bacterium]MDE3038222.1 carboxylating nicotinate-nucleotide diphosphorylase [Pseudomonadota bacterium]
MDIQQLAASHQQLIKTALSEDIGPGDITPELLIPASAQAELRFVAREAMVACGTFIPAEVYAQLIPSPTGGKPGGGRNGCTINPHPLDADERQIPSTGEGIVVSVGIKEGTFVMPGTVLATATGPARALLTGERVALNFMQRMCGVATLTRRYVEAIKGTKAVILDTRKTIPGFRALDKYAVRTGGGQNHRMGLYDMVLVKDNHIAISGQRLAVSDIVNHVKTRLSAACRLPLPMIVVECDTLQQVKEALTAVPDRILLDNMSLEELREAVALSGGKIPLEASGGVSLETARAIAETGVDYISVGKLTHSAPAADIGADAAIKPA